MSDTRWGAGSRALAAALALVLAGSGSVTAAERQPAAKSAAAKGMILSREKPGGEWRAVDAKGALYAGDTLLGLPGASLVSANGAVELGFLTDIYGKSPFPIKESAVILHARSKADLELTLDRGRIDLVNKREKGAAHVVLHLRKERWDLTLEEPGSKVSLETYGRWAPGVKFTPKPSPNDAPTSSLIVLVLKGEVVLDHGQYVHRLKAPPGPAMIEWDSVNGQDPAPHHLKALPDWATKPKETADLKKKRAMRDRFVRLVVEKGTGAAIDAFLNSDDANERRMGVNAAAALDDLKRLGSALVNLKHPDVYENGVLALRHWIGRGPGQDQVLYNGLKKYQFSDVHAQTVLQLLHGYGENELAQPETYQTLISYLDHGKLAIRGLAYWHLVRLVPAGKKFKYDAWASKKDRAAAIKKWRELVPEGKVPPRPEPEKKKTK
jgi:hypothetical protein